MPNRRASRNAYYFFVQERMPELRRRGLPVTRVADAIPHCSAEWAVRPERVGWAVGRGVGEGPRREALDLALEEWASSEQPPVILWRSPLRPGVFTAASLFLSC